MVSRPSRTEMTNDADVLQATVFAVLELYLDVMEF